MKVNQNQSRSWAYTLTIGLVKKVVNSGKRTLYALASGCRYIVSTLRHGFSRNISEREIARKTDASRSFVSQSSDHSMAKTSLSTGYSARKETLHIPLHGVTAETEYFTEPPQSQPQPAPELAPEPVPEQPQPPVAPVKLTEQQLAQVDQWAEQVQAKEPGGGAKKRRWQLNKELENRREAARRIREASEQGARELSLNNLTLENLPEALGAMVHLEKLDCSGNRLSSAIASTDIPLCIQKLVNLRELDLSGFSSEKPWLDALQHLPRLERLGMDRCFLTALPNSIGQLKSLKSLSLAHNQLQRLPASFTNLKQLQQLVLTGNRFTGVPAPLLKDGAPGRVVSLDFNPVPRDSLQQLAARNPGQIKLELSAEGVSAQAHTLHLCHSGRLKQKSINELKSEALINHWFQLVGRPVPQGLIEKFADDETIKIMLRRLVSYGDYLADDRFSHLANRVVDLMVRMHKDDDIYQAAYDVAHDSTQECEDKSALVLADMELAAQAVEARRQGPEQLAALGVKVYRMNLLDMLISKHVADRKVRDPLETQMAFRTALAGELDLPFARGQKIRNVLYVRATPEQIHKAGEQVQRSFAGLTLQDHMTFLSGWQPWQQMIASDPEFLQQKQSMMEEINEQLEAGGEQSSQAYLERGEAASREFMVREAELLQKTTERLLEGTSLLRSLAGTQGAG